MDDDPSSCCSVVGGIESSVLSLSSYSISSVGIANNESNYCQNSDDDDYALVKCLFCSS